MKLFRIRFNLRRVVATIILVALLLLPILSLFGSNVKATTQGGVLDTTWPSALPGYTAYATVVAPDGKIWVGDAGVKSITTAGASTDVTANNQTTRSLAVQETESGTFVIAGGSNFIFRYSAAGVKDTTFGTGQSGTHNVLLVNGTGASQKIFAGATNDFKRYSASGALEATVGMGGEVRALENQTVGSTRYVLVGGAFGLKRYTTASVIDGSFTANPGATVRAIKVQSDGKILVAGTFGLKRYNADGSVDDAFPAITTSIISLAIQSDGKIIAGTSTALLRYSSAGVAETAFNTNAALNGSFESASIALEASGNIIVVGGTNSATKRFMRRYSWENVAPGTPQTPTAVASDRSAIVTVAAGSGATPTGYTVYVNGDVSKNCVVTGSSGNCTVTGLTNGTSYSFYAVARNIDATSANSATSNVVTPADTVAPVISSAVLDSLGTKLTLTYDETLGATTAGTGAFTVSAGGSNFVVNSVTVNGSSVELGLASVIGQGLTVTVSYAAPASNSATTNQAIQDVVGNDAVSLSSRAVTNGSTIDTTAPIYVSSAVNSAGTILTLTYGEAIHSTTAPTSAFTVTVNSVPVTVNSVTVSGSTIQLALATTVGTGQPVTFAYSAPANNSANTNQAIQDAVGNDSISLTSRAITTNSSTVDLTAPAFSNASVNSTGTVLTLSYNETLNSTTAPTSAFSVTVNGIARTVNSAVVSGSGVQLTLASPVGSGQTVVVSYTAPSVDSTTSNSAIQDTAGNDAISRLSQAVSNSSTLDLTAPVFSSATVNTAGTLLTLNYNETLFATTAPTSAFTVTAGGVSQTISSLSSSTSTLRLSLASAIERGVVVTVSYAAPTPDSTNSNSAIQDAAGNDSISLSSAAVTNSSTVDTTAPVLSSAVLAANGTTLTLTYNEALNATTAATTDFAVLVDGSPTTVSARSISGSTVLITLSPAVLGSSTVTVAYNAPSSSNLTTNNAVQDTAGNDALSFSATAVTNNSTEGPPRLVSAVVASNGSQVTLTWSETLGSNSYSTGSLFTILVNGSPVSYGGMGYSSPGSSFTLNISPTITSNQTVTVSYAAPVSNNATSNIAVQDSVGNDALAFTNTAVTNNSTVPGDTTAPTLLSASINTAGTVLSLAYNETLNATTASASDFTVSVNGVPYSVSSVAISTSVVQLSLGSAVEAGSTVTVSYTAPTPNSWATNLAVQDSAGNDAVSLSLQTVTNNSTAGPDIAPPTLSSVNASGTTVTLQFNETLKSTPTPSLSAFTVFVGETPVVPTAISISGSSVSLTLPSSVPSGTEVRVSYLAPTSSSADTNAAIQDVIGNDALSFSGTTRPTSTTWNWVETFDSTTMSTNSSNCPGGGSINRSKQTVLPNGITYTVGVTGSYLCIHDATESLSERGGAAGMFVATGLVTEPGLKLTTSNEGCLANEICGGRGRLFLTFSQPVVNPVFSFAGWGGAASGVSWSEMRVVTSGVTMSKLSGTNILVSADGRYVEDNGQSSSTRCNASTSGSSAVCGSLQLNGTITTVEFELFQQTSGGTGNEDTWNLTASMAEDFGLVPTTYESSGVASHGVGSLKLGATVEADQASTLYANTNADAVPRWTSLATNAKKDDGVAAWVNSPTINFGSAGSTYSTTVALSGVERTANLCGWIDFNRDEFFAYSERTCATDPIANATSATLTWTVPAGVGAGITYARVRLSYDTITDAIGKLGTGEVEDYSMLLPSSSLPSGVNDASTDGQDINQTISPLTNDQFETGYPGNNSTLKLCGSGQTPNNCTVTTLVVANQGTYTVNADGTVTFNPLPNFTGTATPVRYQITDTQATPLTTSATITPTVVPRPTATADTSIDLLNVTQTKNPLTNDTAGSSDAPLSASSVRLCGSGQSAPLCNATSVTVAGGVYSVNQTTGVITFVPTNNFTGTATPVTYQVSDSLNQVASSTYTPTVVATPTASNDTSSGAWNIDQTISPFSNDTNASGYPLGSLALCGTSPAESPNSCSQPVLTTADGTYTVNANGTVTFDPLPTFTGTVTQPVRYQAVDGLGQYVNATITPSVTAPPAPTAVADTSSNQVNVTQTKNVLANDTTTDPLITLDATSVRLCESGQVSPNCTATLVTVTGGTYSVDTTTGVVSFTPTSNWTGTATPVTYQVTDSTNQKVSSTYTPTVIAAVNDTSIGAWNVNQTISPFSNDVSVPGKPFGLMKLCDTSETPNDCTLTSLTVPNEGTYTVNANGTVTFDPLPTFTGTATAITYQAVDDLGQYVSATITPSVTAPAAPVAVNDTSTDFLNVVQTKNPLSNDTTADPLITLDPTSVRLCGTGETAPACTATSVSVANGSYSVNTTTGVISFTPDTNWSGTAPAVTYQVTDSTNQKTSATYTPTVYPKPTASNDTSSGAYDTNQVISPFANDGFADSAPVVASTLKLCGSTETPNNCTQTSLTVAGEGTYTVNANGTVTFDPLPTFRGTAAAITYQAADTLGQYVSATITPTVAAPTAPVATAETESVLRGGTATFTTITGTAGLATGTSLQTSGANATCLYVPSTTTCDSDNVISISGVGVYTLNPATGVVTFVADSNAVAGAQTTVTYRVTDITGQTATSTLTPVVPPAPAAVADTSTGNYDTDQTLSILSDDTPGDASAPLVPSTVKLCGTDQTPNNCNVTTLVVANQGTYTVNADGSVTFDPLSTFTGTATPITYQVADSLGQVASATITVTVRTPPDAVNDVSSGNYDTNQLINPLTNDVDGSGTIDPTWVKLCAANVVAPNCTSTSLTIAGEGTYTVNQATGVVTFDPLPSFTGAATPITYQISDSFGQTDSATITPTVGAPPLPVAVNDTSTGNWDTNQTITPTSNDTPGSTSFPFVATSVKLCATGQTAPSCNATTLTVTNEGTYTVNANGTVTFDPLPTFSGTATPVTYQATDTLGRIDDATITPTVTPPPAPVATPETKAVIPGGTATFTTITGTSGLATGTQLQTSGAKATCLITPSSSPAACDADNVVTIAGEGTFTLNPTTGVVTFVAATNATAGTKTALTYRVTDVTGQTATSTLTPVIPQPPVANPDTNTGDWDTNQTISPLTNDTAGDASAPLVASTVRLCGVDPVQNPNNCTQTSLTIANQGTYTVNANGTVTFDPLPTFNGTATAVKYQVADTLGQVANSTITPTVRAPRAPTPTPDTNTGSWDTNQTISPLTNDTPGETTAPLDATTVKLCGVAPNAQTPNNCTQTSLTITNQGTYTVNANGTVTFDPLPSFTGTATAVKYQVTDVIGQTVNSTITPTVLAPPAPVASPGTVSLIAGGTEEFDPIFGTGALAEKAIGGPDLTNSTVCIVNPATNTCGTTSVTIAGEGTFTLDTATGIVTYTALSTATSGTKTAISYKITDALNVTVTSTLTPSIIPKPTARPDTSIGVMEQTQTLSPVGNDSPGAITYPLNPKTVLLCGATETAPTCTKTTVTVAGEGTYVVQSNGTVQFTPESTYYGTATSVSYIVKDSLGQVATSTLTPKVVPPPAPITELDTGTAEQGSPVVLSPWSNDNGGVVPSGVSGTVELVPNSIRLCGPTDTAPTCTRTSLTTDDGTYTVNTTTGQVTFVHRAEFIGTVTQPVTYQIANNWTGLSGIGITTNILIPTIIPPAPPAPAPPAPAPAPAPATANPWAVEDVSRDSWDTNQIISVFLNDEFLGSSAMMPTLRICAHVVSAQGSGPVTHGCDLMSLTVSGEGTYTVNADGTVTFDPLPSFHGTATPIRYQATDALGRYVNATITPTVDAPPIVLITRNELPATGNNVITPVMLMLLLSMAGFGLRRRFKNA
ncbi:hypothetical protein LBMAG07_02950 [Actinomycetes bacterium]|nr:hypothetical protein LBMAG07_02950 [Actinomycetes bacterium]